MRLEQLGTAGRTTAWCIRRLARWIQQKQDRQDRALDDEEQGLQRLGRLRLEFWHVDDPGRSLSKGGTSDEEAQVHQDDGATVPVQTHMKLSVFDSEVAVLGSGNMDRASWYTSQELGVAIHGVDAVQKIVDVTTKAIEGRTRLFYDSRASNG